MYFYGDLLGATAHL